MHGWHLNIWAHHVNIIIFMSFIKLDFIPNGAHMGCARLHDLSIPHIVKLEVALNTHMNSCFQNINCGSVISLLGNIIQYCVRLVLLVPAGSRWFPLVTWWSHETHTEQWEPHSDAANSRCLGQSAAAAATWIHKYLLMFTHNWHVLKINPV